MDLSDRWPLPDSPSVRDELAAAYADPSRGYHDTRHLTEVLDRLDELAGHGAAYDATPVLLAAWFHDAVYDGERDAEERSAAWAEDALAGRGARARRRRGRSAGPAHRDAPPEDDDTNGCALSDADLGILAAPRARYDEYVAAVRREYAHLEDAVFDAGRADVLRGLAAKPHLFHTAYARERWEAAARENLERELGGLEA